MQYTFINLRRILGNRSKLLNRNTCAQIIEVLIIKIARRVTKFYNISIKQTKHIDFTLYC